MVRAFVMLTFSILPAFALAGSCDAHSPDEGSVAVQLMGARSLKDSADVGRPGAGAIFGHGPSRKTCPTTIAPAASRSTFKDFKPSAQKCIANNVAYIKVPKTGSSTMAGIFRRIAARNGLYGVDVFETCASKCSKKLTTPFQEPAVCANHIERFKFLQRSKFQSPLPMMLFATVRDPLEHALSYYAWVNMLLHKAASGKLKPEDAPVVCSHNKNFREGSTAQKDRTEVIRKGSTAQYRYLSSVEPLLEVRRLHDQGEKIDDLGWSKNDTNVFLLTSPTDMLAEFQVVGQTDRMAEAALLMAFSLKLSTLGDVLHLCTKCLAQKGGTTHSVQALPEEVRRYIRGPEYKHIVKRDQELYDAAGSKMDKQINMVNDELKHIGHHETFGQILGRYDFHLKQVVGLCEADAADAGCYYKDNGCGYACLDMYSTNHSMELVLPVI